MTLHQGIFTLYRKHLLSGAIQLIDNGDGLGPQVVVWDENAVGVSQAIGMERALAQGSLTLTRVNAYKITCQHTAITGHEVLVTLFRDGQMIASDPATVNGDTASEIFIVPPGRYTIRFTINVHPFISGELETELWQS